jgi:hypothetical protein
MSVTGQKFIDSAKTTIGILSRFFALMSVANFVAGLLIFWGVFIISVIILVGSNLLFVLYDESHLDVIGRDTLVLICTLGSIIITTTILSVLA